MGSVSPRTSTQPQVSGIRSSWASGAGRSSPASSRWLVRINSRSSSERRGWSCGNLYSSAQAVSQTKPKAPVARNPARQPQRSAMIETIGAAAIEPSAVPELKMPMARARSRMGNHSLTARIPPVKLPGSNTPSTNRETENWPAVLAKTCSILVTDHPATKTMSPRRVPMKSTTRPLTAYITP